MLKSLPLSIRQRCPAFFTAALSLIILFFFFASGLCAGIDRALYDLLLTYKIRLFPRPLNPRIIHVDLNDSAEAALGEALDTRRPFVDLLSVLNSLNAKIAFDFVFPSRSSADGDFAAAARKGSIFALVPVEEKYGNFAYDRLGSRERELLSRHVWHIKEYGNGTIPRARTFFMSNYDISSAASQLGHIAVSNDSDGVYRRTPLLYRWEDGVIPAVSLAMVVQELNINPDNIEFYPGKALILPLGGDEAIRVPVDKSASLIIPYTESWDANRYRVSFDRVIRAAGDQELYTVLAPELSGSIVMAADTTTAKRDFGIAPFATVYPLSGIHTALISGMLDEYFYGDLISGAKIMVLCLVVILSVLLSVLKNDAFFSAGFLLLSTLFSAWTLAAWFLLRIVPWYGTAATGIFLFWLSGFIVRLFRRYREQLLLKTALSRYFPRSLAQRIVAEGKTELVPAYKELTILFSDISGFTTWSSDKEPGLVHGFLSDYLETMAAIVFEHGGTVDKFMGDGILAFFGDPFDMADHAWRCVNAAVAMQRKIRELAELWKTRANIDLKVRMGINRGRVIVGNLGSRTRIEYTVIGAAVNLAQRMESGAPAGGILVTSAVRAAVRAAVQGVARNRTGDDFTFSGKREVLVKGYQKPIEAYEVIFQED
ncbi:MAG: adenylate/guanylate cyclase domain-containing protein [Treponema sp.]|jgi:adenylate cyclase|nr:adenylate/guanylate cyclase domain-containing protein [Treponema sp.]